MPTKIILGEFEQTVMLAILQLGDDAYAPNIARHLEDTIDRSVSRGALYSCLNQLEHKGFLRYRIDSPTPMPFTCNQFEPGAGRNTAKACATRSASACICSHD